MKYALICKRFYTNKDLIEDKYGRLFYLPYELGKMGHKGLVIALDYYKKEEIRKSYNGTQFVSLPIFFTVLPAIIRVIRAAVNFKPEVIITSGDTYQGLLGMIISRLLGVPHVFDIYDDYREFGTNRFLLWGKIFDLVVHRASLVIVASKALKDKINSLNDKIIIISNGVDEEIFRPRDKSEVRAQLGIDQKEVLVGYFGTIDVMLGIDILIDSVRLLRRSYPGIRLLLAGYLMQGRPFNDSWIDYRGMVDQESVAKFICACDVVVIPYLPVPLKQTANPCKIAEYVACDVPIVTTNVADYPELTGVAADAICEPGNAESMMQAILAQLEESGERDVMNIVKWEDLADILEESLIQTLVNHN